MTANQLLRLIRIDHLGALRVRGADAASFLQGQLSSDVLGLPERRAQLAGYHTPQGRALAVLRLVRLAADDILAVLPRELAGPLAGRLRKYVLRAKAKVEDASADWAIAGLVAGDAVQAGSLAAVQALPGGLPSSLHDVCMLDGHVVARVGDAPVRWLVLSPAGTTPAFVPAAARSAGDEWRALDIAAGLPQVYAATSEAFVAQMLNLDVLGGIAFDKGCYTGQEVIARAHYRGRVKRRMQRFRTLAAARLMPGDAGTLRDGRSFKIVESVTLADGRCEFLAVAAFGPDATGGDATESGARAAPATSGGSTLDCESLPLPYALPDQ